MSSAVQSVTVTKAIGHYRWTICALLFFSTTINYMDRQVLGLLKPVLMPHLHWTEADFGDIVATFSLLYAFGYVGVGRFMDKVGVKVGLPAAVASWSLFACLHAAMSTVLGFKVARGLLGLAEGGNFPASIKTVAEWFPTRERSLATGIFNAGSNVGAVVAPIIVPLIVVHWGWRPAFVVTGAVGFLWVVVWLLLYRNPDEAPKLSAAELAYIRSDPAPPTVRIPWLELLRYRGTWAFIAGTCLSAPVWWFYLNWVPGFLDARYHVNLMAAMLPLVIIYCMADIGSIGGGYLSSHLIQRGVKTLRARKMRYSRRACVWRCSNIQCLVCSPSDRLCRCRASGLFGQSVHHRLRHDAAQFDCLRCWSGRFQRLHRRCVCLYGNWPLARCDPRQLSASVCHRIIALPDRIGYYAPHPAQDRIGNYACRH